MPTEYQNVEELIQDMMSFLDDSSEETQLEEQDDSKNPLCWAIKRIINVIPTTSSCLNNKTDKKSEEKNTSPCFNFYERRMQGNQLEKLCRHKDPYIREVNRLMAYTPNGFPSPTSKEYHKIAEDYALYGKEFLDFPTDIRCLQPTDGACFGEMSSIPSPLTKVAPSPGFLMRMSKSMNQLAATNIPQQQFLVNQTNYCSYPFFPAQPLLYSNPFLMSQYCNTFVNETQINTSLVQQQQFMAAGIHERLVHAQMLQQVQTNQTAGLSSLYFPEGRSGSNCSVKCRHELVKFGPTYGSDVTASVEENSTTDLRF